MHGALDIEDHVQLRDYLRRSGRIDDGEDFEFTTLPGGVSNRTVLVRLCGGAELVIKQALSRLRTKAEWFSDPARSEREALGIKWLSKLAPAGAITPLIFEDPAHHVLAMRAVPAPHENWKSRLLAGRVRDEEVRQFAMLLAAIHAGSARRRDELKPIFRDTSFFESLRVEPYYLYSAAQAPQARVFLHGLVEETRRRKIALVHGDYSPKNVLVHGGRLVLLDHEVIHWGDPAFDVGFSMAHFLSKLHHLPAHRAAFHNAAKLYWEVYLDQVAAGSGDRELESMCVRHSLGCTLARVAGRSPLEYLDSDEQRRQRDVVIALMHDPPRGMRELVDQFAEGI